MTWSRSSAVTTNTIPVQDVGMPVFSSGAEADTALVKCLVQQQNAVSFSNQRRGDGTISGGAQSSRAADRLASARPEKRPAPATNRRADPALIQRLGQGTRERDGQERAGRLTVSLMGTWSALHRSGTQTEKATFPGHPAAAMTSPNQSNRRTA